MSEIVSHCNLEDIKLNKRWAAEAVIRGKTLSSKDKRFTQYMTDF